jgi:hypothetical protein
MTRTKVTNSSLAFDSGPLSGFRNAIINGNFDIWQRGTSFSNPTAGAYTADRWVLNYNGSGATRTISRQLFTLGQTDVPGEPQYFLRYAQTAAGSGGTFNVLTQRIEGVRTFAGQTITISFYAKATTNITTSINLFQNFGTGGSPSATTFINGGNISVGTTFTKYSSTITIPSITGKTIGTNNNDHFVLDIALPLNTTFTFDIAQVQIERGPVATPFERRPIGTELNLCYRYFQQLGNVVYATIGSGVQQSTTASGINVPLLQPVRTNPIISFNALIVTDRSSADAGVSSVLESRVSETSVYVSLAHTAFGALGRGCLLAASGAGGYLRVSAEL